MLGWLPGCSLVAPGCAVLKRRGRLFKDNRPAEILVVVCNQDVAILSFHHHQIIIIIIKLIKKNNHIIISVIIIIIITNNYYDNNYLL